MIRKAQGAVGMIQTFFQNGGSRADGDVGNEIAFYVIGTAFQVEMTVSWNFCDRGRGGVIGCRK